VSVPALLTVVARLPLDVPVEITREDAQRLARIELAKPEYRQDDLGLVERVLNWILERLGDALDVAGRTSPAGWLGLLGVVLLVVLAVIAVRRRTGALGRSASQPLFTGRERTAHDHRREAERFAAAGAWAEAVRERLRAIVRDVEERGLVDARPGRTADEVARDAGDALPSAAGELRDAARVFDDVWYGGRTADAASYSRLVAVDEVVRAARPGDDTGSDADRPMAVPR
jgi:Domain of unknown function (DUF4129)